MEFSTQTIWQKFVSAAQLRNPHWLEKLEFNTQQADLLDYMGKYGDDCVVNALEKQLIPTITNEQTKALLDFMDRGFIPRNEPKDEPKDTVLPLTRAFANKVCEELNACDNILKLRFCYKNHFTALVGYNVTILRLFDSNIERYYAKGIHQLPHKFEAYKKKHGDEKFDALFEIDTLFNTPTTPSRIYVVKDEYIPEFYD